MSSRLPAHSRAMRIVPSTCRAEPQSWKYYPLSSPTAFGGIRPRGYTLAGYWNQHAMGFFQPGEYIALVLS